MAEIMDAKSVDGCKLCYTTKPLSEVPCMRSFEVAFEPRVGLGREDVFVMAVARESAEGGDGHVGQLNSLGFVVFRLPDGHAGIPGIEIDVASFAAQDLPLPHPGSGREHQKGL